MNNILFDLSGRIETRYIDALSYLKQASDSFSVPFIIIGAFARDLIFEHCYHIRSPGRTLDIDLGVLVTDWDRFTTFTDSLLASGKFEKEKVKQRFRYKDVKLDILPFGPVADDHSVIEWPPDQKIALSVAGFDEVYRSSRQIILSKEAEIIVRIPSPAGLALLKIFSWKDGFPDRKKHAEDLFFIMRNYADAGNMDRLYEKEQSLLVAEEFDTELAGIRLLGRDIAGISTSETLGKVAGILEDETVDQVRYNLVTDMFVTPFKKMNGFDEVLKLVEKLREGLNEKRGAQE